MGMVKKIISLTERQDSWIKAQLEIGHFGNESELIRELIRERQMQERQSPAEVKTIQATVTQGEQSGHSKRSGGSSVNIFEMRGWTRIALALVPTR